ncbi:hypothetical protein HC031_22350 [Planosporangium thailandense]|uniref:Uncharacterized protein n=1 Tax=Planosporangium thailandense TaxID=765197 RepID=A0ABX0Y256_9ACTN|nr:hypothetical protein [Planosporangium thailandense]NJC72437.1 hypothetical protein [Planosporangium thailandense]
MFCPVGRLNSIGQLDQAAAAGRGADLRPMADNLRHTVGMLVREGASQPGVSSSLYTDGSMSRRRDRTSTGELVPVSNVRIRTRIRPQDRCTSPSDGS